MEKVRYKKGKKEDFLKLESKDENIIYILNESGDFSEENLDSNVDLYIGSKKVNPDITDTIDDTPSSQNTTPSPKAVKNYVDEAISLGYAYMGIATTSTTPKDTLRKMFYLASQTGDYSKFGLMQVKKSNLLMWNGRNWFVESVDFMTVSDNIVQELGANHDKVMSQASVTAEIKNTLKKFAWKDINK